MDLIVSTPQGEAEISVSAVHESVTIGDLLERVLTSTPPALVYIDGRPTPVGTLMGAAGLTTGTVIDLTAPLERPRQVEVTLVQAAGEGGGNRRPLEPGRYSLGTARRANVGPLTFSQVLVPRCELVVEHSGKVTVTANQGDLDGHLATAETSWERQRLRIGHRVFRLDGAIEDRAASLVSTPLGQLNFVRGPRHDAAADPEPNGRARSGPRRLRRARGNRAEAVPPPIAAVDPVRVAFDTELDNVRRAHLDLGEVIRRALQLSQRLWERHPADDDAFVFSVGLADQPWVSEDETGEDLQDLALLPSAPVLVDLVNQRGVGFASTPPQARAAARALVVQACVAHSPNDLDVVVLSSPEGAARWEWVKWLPHARGSHGVQLLSDDEVITDWVSSQRTLATVVASIQPLGRPITPSRLTLAVVDDPALWRGRAAMLRGLFAEAQLPIRFVAITDRADDVPAVCTTVVRIAANGAAEVDYPISGRTVTDVVPFVLEHDVALAAARRLSPLEDHTAQQFVRPLLPSVVPLLSLIDPDGLDTDGLLERWSAGRRSRRLRVSVGVGESGPVELDLSEDGPHVMIVGARRSGKTELLRGAIASLIAVNDPATVNIICVEPSEGASFAAFAGVDHVVGAVDQFDEHQGFRLLRALRSEVNRRARALADNHVATFSEYHQHDQRLVADSPPMPRLVIVVDDADDVLARHATFLPQLLELADPSRHLGVHLVIAAERLSRSLENVLDSFANIRIGLRMNDPAEAIALTGGREPVQISSHTPGRGVLKVGDADSVPVQFASASAASSNLIEVAPFIIARDLNGAERKITAKPADAGSPETGRSGLQLLTEAVTGAAAKHPNGTRRQILCPQLPTTLPYEELVSVAANMAVDGAAFAVSDLPDDHTQNIRLWNPAHDGNLLVLGGAPAERSDALATLFVAATDHFPTDRLHGYVIDGAPGPRSALAALELLSACGAVATADDPDRILRVLLTLTSELDRRAGQDVGSSDPHIVLVVNDIAGLLRTLELGGEFEPGREMLDRLAASGPSLGITMLTSCAGEHSAPARTLGQFQQRIVLHLDDRGAYRPLDIASARIPPLAPGRAITLPDLVEIQLASMADLEAAIAERRTASDTAQRPFAIAPTPEEVILDQLGKSTEFQHGTWRLPVGVDTRTLDVGVLHLEAPGGALILGDAGAGKTTLLANLARCALAVGADVDIHAIAPTRSPLLRMPRLTSTTTPARIDKWAAEFFARSDRSRLVFIDDADRLEGDVFARLAALQDPGVVVVIAGRTRVLELPSHWTAPLRSLRSAVILRPLSGDGAMFGLNLRVTAAHPGLGRGLLVNDHTVTPILLAGPSDGAERATP
ncbi:MAG TPA: FtsK/SpoIIIE domain-containing protein [Ilumatobacteraceae bacterium]|nr:FtsK/SpoIIIE domain-containing protein [Ilumatobacteraceae bacterium]